VRKHQLLFPQIFHNHPHDRAETQNGWVPLPPIIAESIASLSACCPLVPRDGTPASRLTKQNSTRREENYDMYHP